MKIFYLLLFFFLFSCSTINKEYVCGDRKCLDKREFNEYFSENLTIEIAIKKDKKNQSVDLTKLNKNSAFKNVKNKKSKEIKKLKKKQEKEKLRAEKNRLKEERKIKKAETKRQKKIGKMLKFKDVNKQKYNQKIKDNNKLAKKTIDTTPVMMNESKKTLVEEVYKIESTKASDAKSICDSIEDCDINKISEILIEKGKKKPFPNIASN